MGLIFECDICKSQSDIGATLLHGYVFCQGCTQRQSLTSCLREAQLNRQKEAERIKREMDKAIGSFPPPEHILRAWQPPEE